MRKCKHKMIASLLLACVLAFNTTGPYTAKATNEMKMSTVVPEVTTDVEPTIAVDQTLEPTVSEAGRYKLSCENPKEDDIRLSLMLSGEKEFPEGTVGQIEVLKDDGSAIQSLMDTLQEDATLNLPLSISVMNDDVEVEELGELSVNIEMDDVNDLGLLYHQKKDDSWEEIEYEVSDNSVKFLTSDLGTFLFVNKVEETEVLEEDVVVTDIPEDAESTIVPEETVIPEKTPSPVMTPIVKPNKDDVIGNMFYSVRSVAASSNNVAPIQINKFDVKYVSGAVKDSEGRYVWTPQKYTDSNTFVYRADYSMSGVFATEKGAFRLELPLHILKDKDGNWTVPEQIKQTFYSVMPSTTYITWQMNYLIENRKARVLANPKILITNGQE